VFLYEVIAREQAQGWWRCQSAWKRYRARRDSNVALRGWLPELAILPAGSGKEHVAAGVVVPAGFGAVSVATVVSGHYYRTVGVRTANDSSSRLLTA
jgi:hypothetical protein